MSRYLRRAVVLRGPLELEGVVVGVTYVTQTCDVRLSDGRLRTVPLADVSFKDRENERGGEKERLSGSVAESSTPIASTEGTGDIAFGPLRLV